MMGNRVVELVKTKRAQEEPETTAQTKLAVDKQLATLPLAEEVK